VNAYFGNSRTQQQENFSLLLGTGMPATHELAIGWDGSRLIFYVDGEESESVATQTRGQWFQLLFDVDYPNGRLSGSFDDVRVTYGD
jgi:hypothetical protein